MRSRIHDFRAWWRRPQLPNKRGSKEPSLPGSKYLGPSRGGLALILQHFYRQGNGWPSFLLHSDIFGRSKFF